MASEATERIHAATPHRRQAARQQGYVAQSHDLAFAAVFLAGVLLLLFGGGQLGGVLGEYARRQFSGEAFSLAAADVAGAWWSDAVRWFCPSLAVVFGVLLCVAAASHLGQTGVQLQPQRLAPDVSRLDPLAAATKMFSGQTAAQQLLNVLKLAVLLSVGAWALWDQRERIVILGHVAPAALAASWGEIIVRVCLKLGGGLLVVGAVDYGFQRWRYELSLRMTPEELREEMRHQNGDPAVQRRRRQVRSALALTQLEAAVGRAQLVLVQGTSHAVALRYDPRTMSAPIVVAKGRGDAAAKIRQSGEQAGIRVEQEPRLAQAIASRTPVNAAIAAEHYQAIAGLWLQAVSTPRRAGP
ncbi:MAG: EscU/YscU/HrcU family type III secretion system export apparatus switch protein [Candidatus Anammoximicrobium sp.]|nr:EscU/YscU/HrcU family type III secretion system export apparatus switch protein [Candidatus Anammoximicrobium sp.]